MLTRISPLLRKFLAVMALVIVLAISIVWIAIDFLAADYYSYLMEKYHVSDNAVLLAFRDSAHGYLIGASVASLAVALLLGYWLAGRLLRPLRQMMQVTRQVTDGNYSASVPVTSSDEIGELAESFNRMTTSLQRLETLRRTMVADVAHELRSPLSNMRGYLEALRDDVVPPTRPSFDLLHDETMRLANLVDDLLQLSNADAAAPGIRIVPLNLARQLAAVCELFAAQAAAKGISIDTSPSAAGESVMADPDKLARVVHNLLDNALRYSPRGGSVHIVTTRSDGALRVTVSNTGPPIEPNDLPQIFERFYRGEKSRSRDFGGAGIGLAIVKELVVAHHGRVGAYSADGSNHVWFELPTPPSAATAALSPA